ncbi:HEAT repeat domain-containing protein [Actinomadura sp. PM05-2]|uniref:HEAT repeat domain-containing protein n=1 Tax=Actinomadura parmotrematis TaxID=2864039 RepID=A0ABS7FS79_9ACTN|nr:HEAT repeat domain-containing protein [Actinomadura parmotrematis]
MDAFARSHRWAMGKVTERDRASGTDGRVTWSAYEDTVLHYVEDAMFGIGYYLFTGRRPDALKEASAKAAQALTPWTVADLCDAFDRSGDPKARGQAVLRLGLAATAEPDRKVYDRISAALADRDGRVRYAALWAAGYTGYEAFGPALRAIAQNDPEEFVRDRAAALLK